MEYSDETINSGFVIGVLASGAYIIDGLISSPQDIISISVTGIFVLGYYWVIGLIFSMIFLIPLRPIFKNTSNAFSCIIFLYIGIIVPMALQHKLNLISTHGIDPYSPENISNSLSFIVIMCFIGVSGAFTAWYTLMENQVDPRRYETLKNHTSLL